VADRPLYPISRLHLDALGGPLGIWQRAVGPIPNEAFGYCTDDVAQATLVDLLQIALEHVRLVRRISASAAEWRVAASVPAFAGPWSCRSSYQGNHALLAAPISPDDTGSSKSPLEPVPGF
jgi:hypothetical protein